jgi:hypothetical protein
MKTPIFEILLLIIVRIPYLLVLVAGLVLAIVRRHRVPRAMRLVAIGCGIMLFNNIASQVIYTILPRYLGISSLGTYYSMISVILGLLSTAGMALILLGAFAERVKVEERGFDVVFDETSPSLSHPPAPSQRTDA